MFQTWGRTSSETEDARTRVARSNRLLKIDSIIGLSILFGLVGARLISPAFVAGVAPPIWAVASVVSILVVCGIIYLGLFRKRSSRLIGNRSFLAFVGVGVLMRLVFMGSAPIYEDDWRRYLWDGAVVDTGVSPYAYPPGAASPLDHFGEPMPAAEERGLRRLQQLALEHAESHRWVNYPFVSTIYPPLAQGAFWLAHMIEPFSLDAWRAVLLATDIVVFILILLALKAVGISRLSSLLYWWNPLLVFTTFNSGHMDVLILPALLAAFVLIQKGKPRWGAAALSVAVGIKFWPLLLAPVLFRSERRRWGLLVVVGLILLLGSSALLAPMFLTWDTSHSGLLAYANAWQRNSFVFPLLASAFAYVSDDGDLWARIAVAALVGGASLWLGAFARFDKSRLASALLLATGFLFFLSPTGYPWYAVWLFVFLPLAPKLGLAVLAVTLPLYYTRYSLYAAGLGHVFDFAVVPIQFLLPLMVLAIHEYRARRSMERRALNDV